MSSIARRIEKAEDQMGIGSDVDRIVLVIGRNGSPKNDEAERERRIEGAIGRQPKAPFILVM